MLNDVAASLFKRPFTELYPYRQVPAPRRTRGKLLWTEEKCKGCMLCVRDCPAKAIEIEVVDRAARRYEFRYRLDRCIYCAQCVSSCKEDALEMSNTLFHLASADRAAFTEVHGARAEGECKEKEPPA
jgi:formate hydrogenlyase subunit 6/NADH:ubiquinone oxidoreductase subunit I